MRPLLFLGLEQRRPHRWTTRDRVLAEAVDQYERSLTESGLPWHIATDPHRKLVLDEHIDYAAALLEQERKKHESSTGAPGLRVTVVDLGPDDD